jgi:hypothetical protein
VQITAAHQLQVALVSNTASPAHYYAMTEVAQVSKLSGHTTSAMDTDTQVADQQKEQHEPAMQWL